MRDLVKALQKRAPDRNGVGCYLCRLILEDLEDDGKLTGMVLDSHNAPYFPRSGELAHLKLEGISFVGEEL